MTTAAPRPRLVAGVVAADLVVCVGLAWQAWMLAAATPPAQAKVGWLALAATLALFALAFLLLAWGLTVRREWARIGHVVAALLLFIGLVPAIPWPSLPLILRFLQPALAAFLLAAMLSRRVRGWTSPASSATPAHQPL